MGRNLRKIELAIVALVVLTLLGGRLAWAKWAFDDFSCAIVHCVKVKP